MGFILPAQQTHGKTHVYPSNHLCMHLPDPPIHSADYLSLCSSIMNLLSQSLHPPIQSLYTAIYPPIYFRIIIQKWEVVTGTKIRIYI